MSFATPADMGAAVALTIEFDDGTPVPGAEVWLARAEALHRQLRPALPVDYAAKMQRVFAGGARVLGKALWRGGDVAVIDGVIVNGSAKLVGWISSITRLFQTGYVYHYAFTMIIGLFVLMTLWINRA